MEEVARAGRGCEHLWNWWTRCEVSRFVRGGGQGNRRSLTTECQRGSAWSGVWAVVREGVRRMEPESAVAGVGAGAASIFDVNKYTENQHKKEVEVRVKSFAETRCMKPTESENQNKNRESKVVQRDISHELPEWLQEFREILVDESTSTELWEDLMQRSADTSSSSHEPPMEPRAYVEPGSG